MKKTIIRFGFIVLVAVIGFSFAACANGTTEHPPLVISGTLGSGGSLNMVSVLSVIGNPRKAELGSDTQTFRAEVASNNTLSGKLKDGSITYELSGQYDPSTKVFSMQAPSSFMIFSIVGKLTSSDAIDADSTRASVKIKDGAEWTSTDLTVTASDQTVDDVVNADMTGVTTIPVYCRGPFTDQILDDLRYTVTKNSITMYDGGNPPLDFTVVEITNADGSTATNSGPWHLIVQGKWDAQGQLKDYTGKFYVSRTFDSKLTAAIGNAPVGDLLFGQHEDSTLLSTAVTQLSGIKMFVAPYCANIADVIKGPENNVYPNDGYSPMFIGTSATANAKSTGNVLKAKSGFTLVLK